MTHPPTLTMRRRRAATLTLILALIFSAFSSTAAAHPLGNFSVNHFTRLEVGGERLRLRYVVDMAEIPALQELQTIDANGDGSPSRAEMEAYLGRVAERYAGNLILDVDGARVPLDVVSKKISTPMGAGNLPTLRVECDLAGAVPPTDGTGAVRRLRFEDTNHRERIGWHEIVITPGTGVAVFNSNAFGSGVTDELKAYPEEMLSAPLDERRAELSFARGAMPAGATSLLTRDGHTAQGSRDRFAELIAVPEVTPSIAFLALLVAAGLGGLHALSPGHGKTVVGAYLVGSRGTARHAAFLGLTVTITHTIGVFALGLVTLFASQYILPERLFPILTLVSGGIVLAIGLSLFVRRLRAALGGDAHTHDHSDHLHTHEHAHGHTHHDHADGGLVHSHGGRPHTHLPPGADGSPVTWRSLLGLGISGGLLPCPSALVVLLSAISLGRVGFGLLLIVAFSLGLASVLTGIGLAFVYAGHLLKRRGAAADSGGFVRVLPVVSAFIITCIGGAICFEALAQAGLDFNALFSSSQGSIPAASVLALGLMLGLKHAVEADHLAAVSTIVSERKSILSASLVGGLWGVGHTISLLVAGVAVLLLRVRISERTEMALEFCVAIMLIILGANALRRLLWRGAKVHFHAHSHGGRWHVHPHVHDGSPEADQPGTHHGLRLVGARPLIVGMIHGLAGSAALMLLVLSTISSPLFGLAYIVVFGIGSIGGMMLMSALVGLPIHLTANRWTRANLMVRGAAGIFSLCFGVFMIYEIGFVGGLFR